MRAQWIALRTLRRGVKTVPDTVEGKPVYTLGPHRFVLPRGAHHFRRIIACQRCGREMVEHRVPIRSIEDLDIPPHRRLCESCAQVM